MKVTILAKNGKKEISIQKKLCTFGLDGEYPIEQIKPYSFSILSSQNSFEIKALSKGLEKKLKGPWNQKIEESAFFQGTDYSIFIEKEEAQKRKVQDWDIADFPYDPSDKKYPEKLLTFLLSNLGLSEGGLFYISDNKFKKLAVKNLQIKDHGELFLKDMIESNKDLSYKKISFETHTVLFKVGLIPSNFWLFQTAINTRERIVLYVPETQRETPKGVLATLMHLVTHSLIAHVRLRWQSQLVSRNEGQWSKDYYWGTGPAMVHLKSIAEKVAPTNLSIMISGETGSGKEGLARYISAKSLQRKIVSLNCASIDANLSESYLFGHKKGAFTGATEDRLGVIEEANGATLFLDEIAELDLTVQKKLLRFLQSGEYRPLGGKGRHSQVRIITATHRDLEKLIKTGEFREDLYFRLKEVELVIAPLRERIEDVEYLAVKFLADVCQKSNVENKYFTDEAMKLMKSVSWPGNIRQLFSFIRKAIVLIDSQKIEVNNLLEIDSSLFQSQKSQIQNLNLFEQRKNLTADLLKQALVQSKQNKTKAAKILGVTPRTLFRLCKEHDIEDLSMT